jgi:hypothetical protein
LGVFGRSTVLLIEVSRVKSVKKLQVGVGLGRSPGQVVNERDIER